MCYLSRAIFVVISLTAVAYIAAGEGIRSTATVDHVTKNDHMSRENSGVCGEHATWKFDERISTFTVSGSGSMTDYETDSDVPWSELKSDIITVVIEEGITTIGNFSFMDCTNMTSVSIASSVTSIGSYAFSNCTSLPSVIIPYGVTIIEENAFYQCHSLTKVTIPSSVDSIETHAFQNCSSLTFVAVLSNSSTSIKTDAFRDCDLLTKMLYLGPAINCRGWGVYTSVELMLYNYNSMSNCNFAGTCQGTLEEIIAKHNRCFEIDGCQSRTMISFRKRDSATEWENRTTEGCVKYICDNKTGNNAIFQCSDNETCIDNVCVPKEDTDNLFTVDIDVNNMDVAEMSATEFIEAVSAMTGIESSQLKIGISVNEKGQVIHIIVYTKEGQSAQKIASSVNDCISQGSCQSTIFRYIANAQYLSNDQAVSTAHRHHTGGDLLNYLLIITITTAIASFLF